MANDRKENKIDFFKNELEEWISENPDGDVGYRLTRVRGNVYSLEVVYPAEKKDLKLFKEEELVVKEEEDFEDED